MAHPDCWHRSLLVFTQAKSVSGQRCTYDEHFPIIPSNGLEGALNVVAPSSVDELLKIPHEPRTGRTEFRNRKKFSLVRLSSTHKMQFRDHIANWLILNECTPRESKTGPIRSPFGGCFHFARVASSVSLWPLPEHIRTAWTVRKHHTDSDYNWLLLASSGVSPAHTD